MLTYRFVKLLLLFVVLVVGGWWIFNQPLSVLQAAGGIVVVFEDSPLFNVTDMMPGDTVSKSFTFENQLGNTVLSGLRGVKTEEEPVVPGLSGVLEIVISETGGPILYGEGGPTGMKTLAEFLADSDGIDLSAVGSGETKEYQLTVFMPTSAGNEYQKGKVVFDLIVIVDKQPLLLPEECEHLRGTIVSVIEGTDEKDVLRGTSASELIIGKGEKDNIKGGGGDDCLIGGDGNDKINGGTGEDVLIGGEGDDNLDGHSDNDLIFGGNGNDHLEGKHGDDIFYGGSGEDKIDGGSGEDLIYGGPDGDKIDGEADNDIIFGEAGNDQIKGGSDDDQIEGGLGDDDLTGNSGDDRLIGNEDVDEAKGNSGIDTCEAEVETSCEL